MIGQRLLSRFLHLFFELLYHEFAWAYNFVSNIVSLGLWKSWVLTALPYLTGKLVLELGPGPGHLQNALASSSIKSVGLEASKQMAKLSLPHRNSPDNLSLSKPRIFNGYAQNMPFVAACFSQVVATFPTEYIFDQRTLAEIWRVLVPGGTLIIVPVANILPSSMLARGARWLFNITGQSASPTSAFLENIRACGFKTFTTQHTIRHSIVTMIHAAKPDE